MQIGRFEVTPHILGHLRLDGGSMFGAVPKNVWEQLSPPDEQNRIQLTARCLRVAFDDRVVLIDVGPGSKWNEKEGERFAIDTPSTDQWGFDLSSITDLVITHFHFDHAGGLTHLSGSGAVLPTFPKARIWVQEANLAVARKPSERERASYRAENIEFLADAELKVVSGSVEIFPDFWVHRSDGHTTGLQWIELRSESRSLVYPSDLMPTSAHIPVPFHMGYDMCVRELLDEKRDFIEQAIEKEWLVVFEHDPSVAAVSLNQDERGRPVINNTVDLA